MAGLEDWARVKKIRAGRGTKDYRRQIAEKQAVLEDLLKYRLGGMGYVGDDALRFLGIGDEEGMSRPMWRTISSGGLFSKVGPQDTNYFYDWGSGRKLNIATNVGGPSPEAQLNSNGQWVFNPKTAGVERWEPISADEYAQRSGQEDWNANNPNSSYAARLAYQGMGENIARGHFTKDPATGLFYNKRPDGSMEWVDRFGRSTNGPSNFQPGGYTGGQTPITPPIMNNAVGGGNPMAYTSAPVPGKKKALKGMGNYPGGGGFKGEMWPDLTGGVKSSSSGGGGNPLAPWDVPPDIPPGPWIPPFPGGNPQIPPAPPQIPAPAPNNNEPDPHNYPPPYGGWQPTPPKPPADTAYGNFKYDNLAGLFGGLLPSQTMPPLNAVGDSKRKRPIAGYPSPAYSVPTIAKPY